MQGDITKRAKAAPKGSGKSAKAPARKQAAGTVVNTQALKSPLAPRTTANLPPLAGVRLATGKAGIKYPDRTDVLMLVLAPGTQVAGVFTQSKTASAPVDWCRRNLPGGTARALVVN